MISLIIVIILIYFAAFVKNTFVIGNGIYLAHLFVTTELCNSHIPSNEVSPGLPLIFLVKSFDIYQLSIVRFHLQKFEVCSLWGELRLHYPVFPEVWLPLPLSSIGKFHYFWNSFSYGSNYQKYYLCGKWFKLDVPFNGSKIL